ncbi:MAG: NAD(P)-dependent dehydrogenase (short-subunit alcohol dehydrogenase family) [Verrucomicrobiales bacterium]|jgi:NAD(P)-dependent dehydrogenase (short-subunit alcohol dehydrogenase family)
MATFEDLQDATVVITGGANGIGEAMTRAFRAQGSAVFFCDVDEARGQQLQSESGAIFTNVDLREESQIVDWIGGVVSKRERIDALINNAARDPRVELVNQTVAAWDDLMATNLRPHMLTAREASPHMPEGSSIVNFSSIVYELGMSPMSCYVATKAGIRGLTRSLARELGPKRIRVNTICPGWVLTPRQLAEHASEEDIDRVLNQLQSIPDRIEPETVAEVALFLASSCSNVITGQEIITDHGWVHG